MDFRVESGECGTWYVTTVARDGITDIVSEHCTRSAAQAARELYLSEQRATDAAERHYAAQYAAACGF